MKKIISILFLLIIVESLYAQDTNKHYSPFVSFYGGFLNGTNLNIPSSTSYPDEGIGGGSNINLNIYLPFGLSNSGILLMGGLESNSIIFNYTFPSVYGIYPMKGQYLLLGVYWNMHVVCSLTKVDFWG